MTKKWRQPMRQVSEKKQAKDAARRVVGEIVRRRARNACEAAALVPGVRCNFPLDLHEVIPRSAWRDGDLEPDNVRLICRAHHDWIGLHELEAAKVGLHGYSWERP